MSAGFTPGPWWTDDRREVPANRGGGAFQVMARHRGEGSSYCVASVNHWESPHANARLISAAPELYEALEGLLATHKQGKGRCCAAADKGRAALAKARGETPTLAEQEESVK